MIHVSKQMLCVFALATMVCAGAAVAEKADNKAEKKNAFTADRHQKRGVACAACHEGEEQPKTATSQKGCLACHTSLEAVAEKTKNYTVNPHSNHLTDSSDIECTRCHQGHKADTPVCNQCHTGFEFKPPAKKE